MSRLSRASSLWAFAVGLVAALVTGCGAAPTATPLPAVDPEELGRLASEALMARSSFRVQGSVHVVIEGEEDQTGTQVLDWTPEGFRIVSEASETIRKPCGVQSSTCVPVWSSSPSITT